MTHRSHLPRVVALGTAFAATLAFTAAPLATTPSNEIEERLYTESVAGTIGLATCDLDDTFDLPANGISRIAVDDASVLKVRATDGGKVLRISCTKAGTSIMTVWRQGTQHSIAINVPHVADGSTAAHSDND